MFVTCHITFGQPSNFVGASLEVTRTIRNNKLHFTWGCSILLLKKGKGPWDRIPFFFNDSDIFKNILILIITSLAIHYSQNVFRGFSILVCIGVQVFFGGVFLFVFFHSSSRAWLAFAFASRFPPFDRKTLKNCACSADPGFLNERFHGFLFLVFLHIKTDGKNKPFFYNYINIQIRTFFSELVQSKKCGKYCLIIIRIGTNTAFLAFSLGI